MAAATSIFEFVQSHVVEVIASLLLLCLLPKFFSFALEQWRLYSAFKQLPCDPNQHFLLGHGPRMVADMGKVLDWFTEMAAEKKWKVMRVNLGPCKNLLVGLHPDALKVLLKSDPKSDDVYKPFVPWLGNGIFTSSGAKWKGTRQLVTPAFHYDILRPYMKVFAEATQQLIKLWAKVPEGESFNAFPYIIQLTLDTMLRCSCSHRSNCQIGHCSYVGAVHELSHLTMKRIVSFLQQFRLIYFFTPDYWRYQKNIKLAHDFTMNIVKQRRIQLEESKKTGEATTKKYLDFLDILLEAKDEAGVGMTDLEIREEVDTFVVAGHDTTACALAWTLYLLALHPEHQEICRKEADDIFDQKDIIETEDLKSLQHLRYCIKETIRLFPSVPFTGRVFAQDKEVCGYMMPKGTSVLCSIYAVHHHPDFWENPEDFDPLRFTPERSKGRHPHAYVPFSAGPRNCIGQEFAMNETRVVLATILNAFEVSLDDTKTVVKEQLLELQPKDGLYLKLKSRHLDTEKASMIT